MTQLFLPRVCFLGALALTTGCFSPSLDLQATTEGSPGSITGSGTSASAGGSSAASSGMAGAAGSTGTAGTTSGSTSAVTSTAGGISTGSSGTSTSSSSSAATGTSGSSSGATSGQATGGCRPGFDPVPDTQISPYGWILTAADFDRDGRPDVAAILGQTVQVFLGRGDGTLSPGASISFNFNPQDLTSVDLDGDGAPDLVTSDWQSTEVYVAMNRGDGTFSPPVSYSTSYGPMGVVGGDFDRDGHADVAAVLFSGGVVFMRGLGDGGLVSGQVFGTNNIEYRAVAGDFDRDGNLDLAIGIYQDAPGVLIALGDGHGAFRDGGQYAAGLGSVYLSVGDFNNDGALDLATANAREHTASILLGSGDGSFTNVGNLLISDGGPFAQGIATGDFDGDGNLDVVVGSVDDDSNGGVARPSAVSILYGHGDGGFDAAYPIGTTAAPSDVVAVDFNGDGRLDVASCNFANSGPVTVFLNRTCGP